MADIRTVPASSTLLPKRPSFFTARLLWAVLFIALLIWSMAQADIWGRDLVNVRGWRLVNRFFQASLHPEFSADFLQVVVDATFQTLSYAVLGTVLSIIIGLVGGLFSSEMWWDSILPPQRTSDTSRWRWFRIPWLIIRALLSIPRAIHEVIWGLFFLNIFGLHPLTAVLALGIHFGASTAKVFSEIFDELPRGAFNAVKNSGATPLQAFFYTLLPQSIPNMIAYGFYRFEASIRASAILGVIGAGGLGYQIFLSLQSLQYAQVWTLLFALFLLSGLTDVWSSKLRASLKGTTRQHLSTKASGDAKPSNRIVNGSLLLFATLVIFSLWYVKFDLGILGQARTRQNFEAIVGSLFPPQLPSGQGSTMLDLSAQTLAMSVLAIAFGSVVGGLLSFPAASNIALPGQFGALGQTNILYVAVGQAVYTITRLFLLVIRAIPPSIWALILMFVMFPGLLPGALALGITSAGVMGRQLAETTENLDQRPLLALKSQGASMPLVLLYGVIPSALPQYLTYILYRWEVCIRETIIVGLVGAGGLGQLFNEQLAAFNYHGISATLVFIISLTLIVDLISNLVRRSVR